MIDKKNARFTVVANEDCQVRLAALAKLGKVSQGDVIGVMLDMVDTDKMVVAMAEVKANKVDGRASNGSMVKKLSSLTPEQRAVLDQMLAANEGKE